MRYTFGVGLGYDRDGKAIHPEEIRHYLEAAIKRASEVFGGCFVTRGDGGWIDPQGKLIVEPGIVITVDTRYEAGTSAKVEDYARYLRALFNQSSVIVTGIKAVVHFVED